MTQKWIVTRNGTPLEDCRGQPHDAFEDALESLLEIYREFQCEDCDECDFCESHKECRVKRINPERRARMIACDSE